MATIATTTFNEQKNNEKNISIDALFILMQHKPKMFKPEMLKYQILCRAFCSEESFRNLIVKESFGEKERTIFMHAIKTNNMAQFRFMLNNYKFDINIRDTDLKSALSYACENGNIEIVTELLNKGAELDHSIYHDDDNFINPVYFAIQNNHTNILQLIQARGGNFSNLYRDEEWIIQEPLQIAVNNRNVEIVSILITGGIDLSNWRGTFPFYDACANGDHKIVEQFIIGGIRGDCKYDYDVTRYDNDDDPRQSETALMCASTIEVVKILVENDGVINEVTADGRNALYINCEKGNIDIVRYLIDEGAKINITTHDNKTPLSIACENNNVEIVNLLLLHGANISNIDYNQYSEVIKLLFQFNEIVNDYKM